MTETKKTVEQLRSEYDALVSEAERVKARLVELKPAVDETANLTGRLNELTGYGRSQVLLAKIALKDALFEREIGAYDTDKVVVGTNCAGQTLVIDETGQGRWR